MVHDDRTGVAGMVDIKTNILSNTIMVVKILMLKTSSRMDGIEEDVLDIEMGELDTFFKFYEIFMGSRVDLVACKLKGGAQSWRKNVHLIRERQGKLPIITWERMERELRRRVIFLVEVYTAEFHRLSSRNDLSETESQQVT
ncbi:hypothetical protein Tco_1345500 [Tanacetum coccineum]